MRPAIAIATACMFLSVGAGARAEESSRQQARAAFKKGLEHFKAERYEEAVTAFREADEKEPSWKIHYNIGQCEAAIRRYGLALEAFEYYLATGGDEISLERRDEVLAEVERLRKMVAMVVIKGREGDRVFVNGRDRGELPLARRTKVSMGEVHLEIRREEELVLSKSFKLFGGDTETVRVPDGAGDSPGTEPTEPARAAGKDRGGPDGEDRERKRVWTWVAFGLGGASAIGAGITGGVQLKESSDLKDRCKQASGDENSCPPGEKDEGDKVKNLGIVTNVLVGVAAAGIVAGVILYFVEPGEKEEDKQVSVVPTVSKDGAQLSLVGRF